MAKLGDRDYPAEVGPEEARECIEVLVNEFGGSAGSEEAFAQAIGHSTTNSGSYLRKRGDLRKYGLMKSRSIEATEFGVEAANPRDIQHEREILFRMLQQVSLLADIYESLNGSEPDELWRILTELTDANPKDAQEAEERVELLYSKMLEFEPEKSDKEESQADRNGVDSEDGREAENLGQSTPVPNQGTGIFVMVGNDEIKLEDVSDSNIDLAKQFLESKKGSQTDSVQMRFG
jgi:hypothetical protein